MFKTNTVCRICKSKKLKCFFDLGKMPLANSFLRKEELGNRESKYPLRVFLCEDCGLSQLTDVVEPEILFRDYVYFSSNMPNSEHFKNYAEEVTSNFISSDRDLVVEIGSNDGILLNTVKNIGAKVLGIDPAVNIAKIANERGVETIPDFFSENLAGKIIKKYGRAKVVIGNNVVAHIDNHHDLMKGVAALLSDDGVFIFEAPYFIDMFENFAFDSIYHEHLSYLLVRPLKKFLDKFGMEIFDVKIFPIQGHSIRCYAGKIGKRIIQPSVEELVKKEKILGLDKFPVHMKLAKDIEEMKDKTMKLLKELKNQGKKIAAYGAPARGNTLLNYYGIGADTLDYATEELPLKIGLYTPGTHIPVIHVEEARKNPPDYFLLLSWNYKNAIFKKEEAMIKAGVKFIMPVGKTIGLIE